MNLENAFQKDIESSSGIILDECITPLADGDYISACGIRHYETANRLLHGLLILPPDYPRSLTTLLLPHLNCCRLSSSRHRVLFFVPTQKSR